MNPVVHFEMPAEDKKRMADFYNNAFGWQSQMHGPDMDEYVLVTTTQSEEDGKPKKPGAINGGFYQKNDDKLLQCPSVVIQVDDLKDTMMKIEKAGGKIYGEPAEIPGIGT